MINYILLAITIVCTIFNIWLTLKDRQGYDKGLEDGIRMTNEVLEEGHKDKQQNYCDDCLYTETCDFKEFFWACEGKATKGEPQTDCPWR